MTTDGKDRKGRGNRDRYGAPCNTFATLDKTWVHIAVAGEALFRALANAMGQAELADDDRFRTNTARLEYVEELEKHISEWTETLTAADLLDTLQAIGVPSAKVASVSDLVDDAHIAHRGQILNMDHPKAGTVPMQGFSVQFGDSPMRLRHPPPMLGEHTRTILTEWLAMTPDRIAQLRESGAI